jgi:hypothetical protein
MERLEKVKYMRWDKMAEIGTGTLFVPIIIVASVSGSRPLGLCGLALACVGNVVAYRLRRRRRAPSSNPYTTHGGASSRS